MQARRKGQEHAADSGKQVAHVRHHQPGERQAENHAHESVIRVTPDSEETLGVADLAGKVDLVLALLVLHEVPDASRFLAEVRAAGFAGVQNFPTVGLIDGVFRQGLEETGMGYRLEVECIAAAHALDLLTTPYAFNPDESKSMAKAGADILIPHIGLTTKGTIGAKTALTLDDAAKRVQAMHDAARKVRKDILVLCHGGPISEPEDAQYILDHTEGIVGFYGASSVERLPTEIAITDCVKKFKTLKL